MNALRWLAVMLAIASTGAAWGQGTKDSSSPTMVFPIRPRDEPSRPNAVPNTSYTQSPYTQRQIRTWRANRGYRIRR